VHQFFYNSSGAIAPQVVEALRQLGLDKQAAILAKGIAQFKEPYPVDTSERRKVYFGGAWNDWDKSLSALTDEIWDVEDAGYILVRMTKFARARGLLPD
jgi:Domain of unknown function (DUF4375)